MLQADARHIPLADNSVQCCVTSPPYWGLRDYGVEGQLGLEPTPELYVAHMVEVFREVKRVLREDGTLWLNLGDSYASTPNNNAYHKPEERDTSTLAGGGGRQTMLRRQSKYDEMPPGLKPKDLVGIPWRVAFALQADGWYLRSDIIWAKPNPMPESVTDRPTKAHEYLFLLSKSSTYYYDAEAIKDRSVNEWNSHQAFVANGPRRKMPTDPRLKDLQRTQFAHDTHHPDVTQYTRNKRSVWTIATEPYPEAHFATFPQDLVKPCVLAGTSEKGACGECGAPWERITEIVDRTGRRDYGSVDAHVDLNNGRAGETRRRTRGWYPTCPHYVSPVPQTVLDPFAGSGTTVLVAKELGRHAVGLDLKPDYLRLAERRTRQGALYL